MHATRTAIPTLPASVDTLLLDLDGTLLDLAFDNHFWMQVVPATYGRKHGLSVQQALDTIRPLMASVEHTLPWYCLDHWARTLDLDLKSLKLTHAGRIGWLPGAREFLVRQRTAGRRLILATNSHPETLRIKDAQTGVTGYLDAAYSSHVFGAPKEDARFWAAFRQEVQFDPARTAFIDDSIVVLRAGQAAGIHHLIAVGRPDTSQPPRPLSEFPTVAAVAEL
ncbi:MAG: GMP/IMP nucleotidase [Pseudomonadota bacterium]